MIEKSFLNNFGEEVYYIKWEIDNPKAIVVISHGMAEHAKRYESIAKYLNDNGVVVYAIEHIGHGEHAKILGHMGVGEFDRCISNLNDLVTIAKNKYNLPCFLLGHSMGSFMSQLYIERYHNLKGVILSGSTKATPIMKFGPVVASLVCFFAKDKSKKSEFMNKMSFGSYNSIYDHVNTPFDWLNRDEEEVKKYVDDPLCGFVCSKSFFNEMTHNIVRMGKAKNVKKVEKDLPILIHGGTMDPVSNKGTGLDALYKQYNKFNINHVELIKYDGARHEIYKEINKEEVYTNTIKFINENI